MLEPSFQSNVSELKSVDFDFDRFPFRARESDAMFYITTVYGIDLPYFTPSTGY